MAKSAKNTYSTCTSCIRNTNHVILYTERSTTNYAEMDEAPIELHEDFMVIKCMGCDTLSFLKRDSGRYITEFEGEPEYIDYNFPEMMSPSEFVFLEDEETEYLPPTLFQLYFEVCQAFDNDSNMLAGVGLRMLVEAICNEQKIVGKNLQVRIEELHTRGLISKNEIPIIHKLRDIGNTSAHEIRGLPMRKLEYALDIINHVLKSIYVLPKINKQLKLEKVKPKKLKS